MKIVNKIIGVALVFVLSLSMVGCNTTTNTKENTKNIKLTIMTTLFPYYDFARAVIGDVKDIDLELLVSPGQDDHSFEPTPKDVVAINNADLFIYNGGSIENWVEEVLKSLNNKSQIAMKMMDYIDDDKLLTEEESEGVFAVNEHNHNEHSHSEDEHSYENSEHSHSEDDHSYENSEHSHSEDGEDDHDEHSHSEDEHSAEYDEHIWTSPAQAALLVQAISDEICKLVPEHKAEFQNNTKAYIKKIERIDKEFREVVAGAKHKEIIFADKFPLKYFAKEYGLKYHAAFAGCSGDTEPSAKTVAFLIDKVKAADVKGIFYLELSSTAMADTICDDTGTKKYQFNSCHNVTFSQFKKGVTYVSLMEENVKVLRKALN